MQLLTMQSAKLDKSQTDQVLNAIQFLDPNYKPDRVTQSKAIEMFGALVCPAAGKCKETCLIYSGRMPMQNAVDARFNRTDYLYNQPELYLIQLKGEIASLLAKANKQGKKLAIRLNGTSDLNYRMIYEAFPMVQFFEYTKRKDLVIKNNELENVHYTFSNDEKVKDSVLKRVNSLGVNISVVFKGKLPSTYKGIKVIDGDKHDRRFEDSRGVIVGLKFKGSKKDLERAIQSGFAV